VARVKNKRKQWLLGVALLAPQLCRADQIELSECNDKLKRLVLLTRENVAVVRTHAGPAAAIILTDLAPSERSYRWRYRASSAAAMQEEGGTFRFTKASDAALKIGGFNLRWTDSGHKTGSLSYCANTASVEYFRVAEFSHLP
jgi:hypothetical protein